MHVAIKNSEERNDDLPSPHLPRFSVREWFAQLFQLVSGFGRGADSKHRHGSAVCG